MIIKPVLKVVRKLNNKWNLPPENAIRLQYRATDRYIQIRSQAASDLIREKLLSDQPVLVARFGSSEIDCIIDTLNRPSLRNIYNYISLKTDSIGWRSSTIRNMSNNAGFFSPSKKLLKEYGRLVHLAIPQIDILGSWIESEAYFNRELENAIRVDLNDLEPYYHNPPWSSVLEGKNVLVIHPFAETIKHQYINNRELLFENKDVLPKFNLQTIKAVQSVAGNNPDDFTSWFDAFEYMKSEINNKIFDYAIIGCGAYGLPLAGYIKEIGKSAIHLGGATQILFGIKGKRWEERDVFREQFINEHWIKPFKEDYPKGYETVEGGCYW